MADTVFRSSTPPATSEPSSLPEAESNKHGAEINIENIRPVEDKSQAVLSAMGIEDSLDVLPESDIDNLGEVAEYISDIANKRGLSQTQKSYNKVLNEIKEEMGLDEEAEPSKILERIGGVVKAWKNLSFIKDPKQKKSLFMKLARMENSKDMNRMVLQEMEKSEIWL